MAHGYASYSNPYTEGGGLSAYIGGKIGAAAKMAASERKARDEEIKSLQEKEELTDDEKERLDFLTNQQGGRKGSFFGKALMSEFGGDRARRLKGTFSKDPDATHDPTLSKEQRFSALLDRTNPAEAPIQPETPFQPTIPGLEAASGEEKTPSILEKAFANIAKSYDSIADRVSSLASEEKKSVSNDSDNNKFLSNITSGLQSIKDYFNKDNKLKEDENDIETQQLELAFDRREDAKVNAKEASMETGQDLSGNSAVFGEPGSDEAKREKKKGILDSVKDWGGKLMSMFGGKGGGKTQYSNPIGPQPMNSPSPWASGGAGEVGNAQGFVPRLPSSPVKPMSEGGVIPKPKKTKLASGGIVDNPTTTRLNPGDSVVPLNRNNAMGKMFKAAGQGSAGKSITDPMAKVMQLPSQVGGGLMLSLLSDVMKKLGGIGSLLKPVLGGIAAPLAGAFGLPATIINAMFGGPAQAATFDPSKYFDGKSDSKKKDDGGPGGPGNTPPPPPGTAPGPGMTASGGSKASGNITSGFGNRSSPGGIGSTNHGGIDIAGGAWVSGAPVSVIKPGVVAETGDLGKSGWGKYVVVKHDDGTHTLYGHLSQINVKKGDKIENKAGAAKVVGKIGSTGASTGPHLHFELGTGWNGTITGKMDPAPYVDNYIRGGGQVTIDAPVMRMGQTPLATQPDGTRSNLGAPDNPLLTPQTSRPGAPAQNPFVTLMAQQGAAQRQQQQRMDLSSRNMFSVQNPTGISNLYQWSY